MNKDSIDVAGQALPEEISAWKAKHKTGIYAIEVDGHIAYFKNPGRAEVNCCLSKADKERSLDVFETLASTTFIGGSEEVLKDDQMFLGLVDAIKDKLSGKKATLVNL